MSMMEMVIVVSMIVRSFRLELVPGQRVEIEPLATTLRPKGGLRMTPRLVEQSPETQGRVPC
jgi:cytochrome P450